MSLVPLFRRLASVGATLTVGLLAGACDPSEIGTPPPRTLTTDLPTISVAPGQSVPVTVTLALDGRALVLPRATWRSADSTVFRLDTVTTAAAPGAHRVVGRSGRVGATSFRVTADDGQAVTVPVYVTSPATAAAAASGVAP